MRGNDTLNRRELSDDLDPEVDSENFDYSALENFNPNPQSVKAAFNVFKISALLLAAYITGACIVNNSYKSNIPAINEAKTEYLLMRDSLKKTGSYEELKRLKENHKAYVDSVWKAHINK
jgi:hypothetical protein